MLDLITDLDKSLFRAINTGMSNDFFDTIIPWLREGKLWAPLYLFLVSFLWINFRRRGLIIGLGLILSVGLTDFTSGTLIKKNVQRVRPCNDPSMEMMIIERVPCGSGYSFTSNHAANPVGQSGRRTCRSLVQSSLSFMGGFLKSIIAVQTDNLLSSRRVHIGLTIPRWAEILL